MKKYRLFAVVMLLAAPTMLVSSPGYSTSRLPEIGDAPRSIQQQNCPVEGGFSCFGSAGPSPATICRQFMQMFFRPRAG